MNLKKANNFFKNGQFELAISSYQEVAKRNDFFRAMLNLNIQIARRKFLSKRDGISEKVDSLYLCGVNIGSLNNSSKIFKVVNDFCYISQIKEPHKPKITVVGGHNEYDKCESSTICRFVDETIKILSLSYSGRFSLRISIEANYNGEDIQLNAYQYDAKKGGHLILVSDYLVKINENKIIELDLINHYKPILIIIKNTTSEIVDAAFIPFPSIFPGGHHENEIYYFREGVQQFSEKLYSQYSDAFRNKEAMLVTELYVDLNNANSTELIFQNEAIEWLWEVFFLRIKGLNNNAMSNNLKEYWNSKLQTPASVRSAEKFNTQSYREKRGVALYLTRNSLPTLTILTSSISKAPIYMGYIYQSSEVRSDFWYIRQIPDHENVKESDGIVSPYLFMKQNGIEKKGELPIAIESGVEAEELIRVKKDNDKKINIIFIVQAYCADELAASLETITLQMGINIDNITFVLENKDAAKEIKNTWRKLSSSPVQFAYINDIQCYFSAIREALNLVKSSKDSDWLLLNDNPILTNVYDLNNLQSILSKRNIDIVSPALFTNNGKYKFRGISVKMLDGIKSYQPILDKRTPVLDQYIFTACVSDNIFMFRSDNSKVLSFLQNSIYQNIGDFMSFSVDLLANGCCLVVYDGVLAIVQKSGDFSYIGYEKLVPFENIDYKLTVFESLNK